jgi:biotin-dependent carboxylase-like uncharacterized protein
MIEILTSGLLNSVQDLGRPGYLDQGIGRGGAMDAEALKIANLMIGNPEDDAGVEVSIFPFRLRFHAPCLFAVTGAVGRATLGNVVLPPWWSQRGGAGDELRIDPPQGGARIYIAFSGSIDLPTVLGSRATDLKSAFGGLDGRTLTRGDRLGLGVMPSGVSPEHAPVSGFGVDPAEFERTTESAQSLRFMPGAEYSAFTDEAKAALTSATWQTSKENNRQGMRLEGPALALTNKLELLSHGIMPGTIQVPPSGQPVIQLAEANTCGGYPKIGHVIEPDLWKLAQASTGTAFRFVEVNRIQAVDAIRARTLQFARLRNLLPVAQRLLKAG